MSNLNRVTLQPLFDFASTALAVKTWEASGIVKTTVSTTVSHQPNRLNPALDPPQQASDNLTLARPAVDVVASLRAILYTQSKSIVEEFHHRKVAHVQMVLAEEKWERCDATKEHRAYVRYLTGETEDITFSPRGSQERATPIPSGTVGTVAPAKHALKLISSSSASGNTAAPVDSGQQAAGATQAQGRNEQAGGSSSSRAPNALTVDASEVQEVLNALRPDGSTDQAGGGESTWQNDYSEKFLKVERINFLVVPSSLMLLKIAHEYLCLCRALQSVAVEAVQRLTHLFKLFNRQMLQLVLQGEAKTNRVLKKVTATNIALCSQTCGMFSALAPRLQEQLQICLHINEDDSKSKADSIINRTRTALLNDFGSIVHDFQDHHGQLLKKLSEILEGRYDVHAKKLFSQAHPLPPRLAIFDKTADTTSSKTPPAVTTSTATSSSERTPLHGPGHEPKSPPPPPEAPSPSLVASSSSASDLSSTAIAPSDDAVKLQKTDEATSSKPKVDDVMNKEEQSHLLVQAQRPTEEAQAAPEAITPAADAVDAAAPEFTQGLLAIGVKKQDEDEKDAEDVEVAPHEACAGLIKDVSSMYRVLLKVLSGENVKKIFARAFENMSEKFDKTLTELAKDAEFASRLNQLAAEMQEEGGEDGDREQPILNANSSTSSKLVKKMAGEEGAPSGTDAEASASGVVMSSAARTQKNGVYTSEYPWGDRLLYDVEHIAAELTSLTVIAAPVREWINQMILYVELRLHPDAAFDPENVQAPQHSTISRINRSRTANSSSTK
ncbi:unnamed protein product [Amoebophrya sp. A25]|nr:unnamed protein product [Amoebophrya sp. A25]|eukprot:GSA25T00001986001.1